MSETILNRLVSIPTPVLADAVVRLQLSVRAGPPGLRGPSNGAVAGTVLPVRHYGSVDVYLEALDGAEPGDVMVIDNGGRHDEACIGDLIAHEARTAGVAGIVIWGLHRDAVEIRDVSLPVFSYGTLPFGPTTLRRPSADRFSSAQFGEVTVTRSDIAVADANGVVFFAWNEAESVADVASSIRDSEAEQLKQLRSGITLREQFHFQSYLQDRSRDPNRTFREHLRELQRAVEE